jgi:hypothetical protein
MRCSMCRKDKLSTDFVGGMYQSKKEGGYTRCLSCHRDFNKMMGQWRKLLALMHYSPGPDGPVCACKGCDSRNIEFLVIDHVDGGGNLHRKQIKNKSIYLWLKNNNYPSGFRVLCWNCNNSRGSFGYCPHESPSRFSNSVFEKFGLNLKGSKIHNSKLTEESVLQIRKMAKDKIPQITIAKLLGVSRGLVGGVVSGKRWKHVDPGEISLTRVDSESGDSGLVGAEDAGNGLQLRIRHDGVLAHEERDLP